MATADEIENFKEYGLHNWQGLLISDLPVEEFVFSAGSGFLFGAVAGYAIKKVIKIAAVVIGLFVVALAYLSYKGWIDVKCDGGCFKKHIGECV
jgi:uncharacterized membrane protein (Fun14 family)